MEASGPANRDASPAQFQQSEPVRRRGCSIEATRSDTGYRYRIILRGECGYLLAGLVDGAAIECGHGRTCITVSVRDDCQLYGLLEAFQDVALHLVSLCEVGDSTDTAG
jgi:hypothetical protein